MSNIDPFNLVIFNGMEQAIVNIEDPEVTLLAQQIAFYTTLLHMAKKEDDLQDDVKNDMLQYFEKKLKKVRKRYMNLTDKILKA